MATKTSEKYIEAIGRRKSATARVRITPSKKNSFLINDKSLEEYFPTADLQKIAQESLTGLEDFDTTFDVTVKVKGSGIHAQAESMRHGLARTLNEYDEDLRGQLKKAGFLKRDPRSVERKKPGLKKSRKAAQWSKR
jgi:small subunit ribosomal protein S9